MRRLRFANVVLTALCILTLPAVEPTARIDLFNGKDLAGLVPFHLAKDANPAQIWTVKDGSLICSGEPKGYLRTAADHANYRMTVEWRFIKPGNTGLLAHIGGDDKTWPTCFEIQGRHKDQGHLYCWGGISCKELIKPPQIKATGADAEKPPGEWNTMEVVCLGDTLTVFVNGAQRNAITGSSRSAGKVALQCEGAAFEVRKWYLEPLKQP